jgi:hypothetical protein
VRVLLASLALLAVSNAVLADGAKPAVLGFTEVAPG